MTVIITLCLAFVGQAQAQRTLPGMRSIQITSGMVDGFYSNGNRSETGYCFGMAIATYGRHANKWLFGAEYLKRNYPYEEICILMEQFTAEGGYYLHILSDASKTFFLSVGTSALTGYETVNRGDKILHDGSMLLHKNRYLYGGAVTLEIEAYLSNRLVLLITGRERILWGTTTGHFHTQFGIGLKYIIN